MILNVRIVKGSGERTDAGISFRNGFRQNYLIGVQSSAGNEFASGSRTRSLSSRQHALGYGSLPSSVSGETYGESHDASNSERSDAGPRAGLGHDPIAGLGGPVGQCGGIGHVPRPSPLRPDPLLKEEREEGLNL